MNKLIAILILPLLLACHQANRPLSPKAFTVEYVKRLKTKIPSSNVVMKADLEVMVSKDSGGEFTSYLENAYNQYLQSPKDMNLILDQYIASAADSKQFYKPIDKNMIVPVVKDRQWLSDIQQSLKNKGVSKPVENVYEIYNQDLIIVYAEDSPNNIRYLTSKDLAELGLSKAELLHLAIANINRLLTKIELCPGGLVSMLTVGGNYEASLILLDDIWVNSSIKVKGNIIVSIPARDIILIADSSNPAAISKLREVSKKAFSQSSYRLTETLFIRKQNKFVPYQP